MRTHVTFSASDLAALDVQPSDLDPFVFQSTHTATLASETLGHSTLERHPLVRHEGNTIVVLPTAIGATVRRFVVDQAAAANDLNSLAASIADAQATDVRMGSRAWGIEPTSSMSIVDSIQTRDFFGVFDQVGDVHVVYVPDNLDAISTAGLPGIQDLDPAVTDRLVRAATQRARHPTYRRGLTLLVLGGIGRGYAAQPPALPIDWHLLPLPVGDFVQLGWDHEMDAARAWKMLAQQDTLARVGMSLQNLSGFANHYAFLREHDYQLVPPDVSLSTTLFLLPSNSVATLRKELRQALDHHAALSSDGQSWLEVQRRTVRPSSSQFCHDAIYVSVRHALEGQFMACVEGATGSWWVESDPLPPRSSNAQIVMMVCEMAVNWLAPIVKLLDDRSHASTQSPVTYRIVFPDLHNLTWTQANDEAPHLPPQVEMRDGQVQLTCSPAYLRAFGYKQNEGDEQMIRALLRGAYLAQGSSASTEADLDSIVYDILGSQDARYIHVTPAKSLADAIYSEVPLPRLCLEAPEDRAWSRLNLARTAGWTGQPGVIPISKASAVFNGAVAALWGRIKGMLRHFDRRSVIERALLNLASIQKDRSTWRTSAAAMYAMREDRAELFHEVNTRERERALAALASRVIAEMSLCTSPVDRGYKLSSLDLEALIADVGTLLTCAGQSDALHHGLAGRGPTVYKNGSLGFDPSIGVMLGPYLTAYGERSFLDAVNERGTGLGRMDDDREDVKGFDDAFEAEFGLSMTEYVRFAESFTDRLIGEGRAYGWFEKDEVLKRLRDAGSLQPERTFSGLALVSRSAWDEAEPKGAERRDWYPWRYGRRLSVLRRPLVALTADPGTDVLIMPTLLDSALGYLFEASSGRLPERLFDSVEMRRFIGEAANKNGHAFNSSVARRLTKLEWSTRTELSLSEMGGSARLGDIDVLAWRSEGPVYLIECKRLMWDRTIGEIGERLRQYMTLATNGTRTDVQKHLDRFEFGKAHVDEVGLVTGRAVSKGQLRSALITDDLTPMQFVARAKEMLDVVVDYSQLGEVFR